MKVEVIVGAQRPFRQIQASGFLSSYVTGIPAPGQPPDPGPPANSPICPPGPEAPGPGASGGPGAPPPPGYPNNLASEEA